jgi:hypothetical protein
MRKISVPTGSPVKSTIWVGSNTWRRTGKNSDWKIPGAAAEKIEPRWPGVDVQAGHAPFVIELPLEEAI